MSNQNKANYKHVECPGHAEYVRDRRKKIMTKRELLEKLAPFSEDAELHFLVDGEWWDSKPHVSASWKSDDGLHLVNDYDVAEIRLS